MSVFGVCALAGLGFWVAGLSFAYWKGKIPLSGADRWGMAWGGIAALFLCLSRSLALLVPAGAMLLLTLHSAVILHPQIADLQRRIGEPKYAGTAHLEKLRFCLDNLRKRSVQLHAVILGLGWLSLALARPLLK